MRLRSLIPVSIWTVALTPLTAFAAPQSFKELVNLLVNTLIRPVIPLVFGFGVLVFFWGIANFILHAGNAEKRAEGKRLMLYGIIVLFVMTSVWGIVAVLRTTFML